MAVQSGIVLCSLRALYGSDEQKNGLHASDSEGSAAREIKFIFPDSELYKSLVLRDTVTTLQH